MVRLHGRILARKYFDRLPNRVSFYNFPSKEKNICGEWRQDELLTWTDTVAFFLDVPAHSIVDLEKVTDRFALGLSFPKVLLIATGKTRTDTISKGDYGDPVTTKFKLKNKFLGSSTLYYDFE